jgi:putative transport protein
MIQWIPEILRRYPEIAVFTTLTLGFLFGQLKIGSFSLGTVAATLLVGVVIGLADPKIHPIAKTLFFDLFIFTIGYKIGPQFFRSFKGDGLKQAALTLVYCVSALVTVLAAAFLLGYDKGLAAGLLAGAVTESAAIGSATEAINRLQIPDTAKQVMATNVAVAYAVTYIFGTVGATWFLSQIGPRLLGINLKEECRKKEAELGGGDEEPGVQSAYTAMVIRAYRVRSARIINRQVKDVEADYGGRLIVERVRHGTAVADAEPETMIREGDTISVAAYRDELFSNGEVLVGEEVDDREVLDFPFVTLDVVVTNKAWDGMTLEELRRNRGRGVRLQKFTRTGESMPYFPDTKVERGDTLTIRGGKRDVERVAKDAGYADWPSPRVGMVWVGMGIVFGALIGIPAIMVRGVAVTLSTAGGILLMGLVFGYLRAVRPVVEKNESRNTEREKKRRQSSK